MTTWALSDKPVIKHKFRFCFLTHCK